jgi:hypothetical protein
VPANEAYEFRVSAPRFETFDWLRRRAEKSGEALSVDGTDARFTVRWRGSVIPDSSPPAVMELFVEASGYASLVSVTVNAGSTPALQVIDDFAGPLGDRMFALGARPPGFFDPPRTRRDDVLIVGWIGLVVASLAWAVSSRDLPPQNETMTSAELTRLLGTLALAAFAPGLAGGLFLRRGSRWYEPFVGGLLVGGLAAYVVFDVWLNDAPGCSTTPGCDLASGFGAALAAVPAALIVVCGVLMGRAIAFTAGRVATRRGERSVSRG